MMADKIMVIRHAEKPDAKAGIAGVTERGQASENDLTVRGWQRAGALVRYFNPQSAQPPIARPGAIFATRPDDASPSKRPLHTVKLLAQDLDLEIDKRFADHDEEALVAAAKTAAPTVLISWHHERIDNIAKLLGITNGGQWPNDRFDLVWVFDRVDTTWRLTQVNQHLLPGDR
jgi:broad specificity phosphatase PhoE